MQTSTAPLVTSLKPKKWTDGPQVVSGNIEALCRTVSPEFQLKVKISLEARGMQTDGTPKQLIVDRDARQVEALTLKRQILRCSDTLSTRIPKP